MSRLRVRRPRDRHTWFGIVGGVVVVAGEASDNAVFTAIGWVLIGLMMALSLSRLVRRLRAGILGKRCYLVAAVLSMGLVCVGANAVIALRS